MYLAHTDPYIRYWSKDLVCTIHTGSVTLRSSPFVMKVLFDRAHLNVYFSF